MIRGSEAHIDDLLSRMTVDEKIGQLNMLTAGLVITGPGDPGDYMAALRAGRLGSLFNLFGWDKVKEVQRVAVEETRLGIPLIFGYDVIHGHRTIFPIPLGEAGAFDEVLWERTARIAAIEAAAEGLTMTFAPMLDVARDPRWGRIAESAGEDTWLTARFAEAKVRGFQRDDLAAPTALASVAKHLAGYGAAMAGRDYAQTEISERTFREVYLPPFHAAVTAGTTGLMPAFTDFNGVPLSADRATLERLVRGEWGFDGVIVSDYNAIAELIPHGVAADIVEAAALALNAGVDFDMMGHAYTRGLASALQQGLVDIATVDRSVRRILELKAKLGLFDDPYRPQAVQELTRARRSEFRQAARDAARRSIILLKNADNLLPIKAVPKRIAILGPLADTKAEMLGPWSGAGRVEDMVSFLEGLRAAWPNAEIVHKAGVPIEADDANGIAEACDAARAADLAILCLGEARMMSGEAGSRARLGLPGRQGELAEAIFAVGKPVVLVLSCGRPLAITPFIERATSVVLTWYLGSEAGHALGDILTGAWNPSARLPVTWPVDIGQIPIFYSRLPTGRPFEPKFRYSSKYLDMPNEPLFAFGQGLSYTSYNYANLKVSPTETTAGGKITIEVDVTNSGTVAGEETVMFFTRDPVASVSRPVLELKAVRKLSLKPGETKTARVELNTDALAFLDRDLEPILEPGQFEIFAGPSAREADLLKASIILLNP
jgi:beta-glucosidase